MCNIELLKQNLSVEAKFKDIPQTYGFSTGLYFGRLLVAKYFRDGATPQNDSRKYKVVSGVSGVNLIKGDKFETEEEAKFMCVRIGQTFLKMLENK
mgnify:CR=1 FL=1